MIKIIKYTKYICNKCGKELDDWDRVSGLSIRRQVGYGSKHDGDELELDLCCSCMDELIDGCVISPIIEPSRPAGIEMTDTEINT